MRVLRPFLSWCLVLGVSMSMIALSAGASEAELDSTPVRQVAVLAGYGAMYGVGAGVMLWPVTGNANTPLVGAGVGFVLGVAAGLYHVNHLDDPENPLAALDVKFPSSTSGAPVEVRYTFRF